MSISLGINSLLGSCGREAARATKFQGKQVLRKTKYKARKAYELQVSYVLTYVLNSKNLLSYVNQHFL